MADGRLALAGAVLMGLLACAHQARDAAQAAPEAADDTPAWVRQGSGAVEDGGQRVFVGVGSVHGIRNPSLARTTADNRARAEIAKVFSTYSVTLMRDYSAATSASGQPGGAGSPMAAPAHEEQDVQQAIKTFSAVSLSGVQIVDHWVHPTDGSIFSLARLDMAAFTREVGNMQELSEGVRRFVQGRAAAAHQELEAQAERRAGAGGAGGQDAGTRQ